MDYEDFFAFADDYKQKGDFFNYILNYIEGLECQISYGKEVSSGIKELYKETSELIKNEDEKEALLNYISGVENEIDAKYKKALGFFEKAREVAKSINNNFLLGWILCEIGSCYRGLKVYNEALSSYFEGLVFAEKVDDKRTMGILHHHIAFCFFELKTEIDKTTYHLDKAREYFSKINDIHYLFNTYTLFIAFYANRSFNIEKVLEFSRYAEELSKTINNPYLLASYFNTKALYYLNISEYEKAEEIFRKALDYANESKEMATIAYIKYNIGYVQYMTKRYKEALETLSEALKEAEKTEDDILISEITGKISLVLKELGKFREARNLYKHLLYTSVGISIFIFLTIFFLIMSIVGFYYDYTAIGIASLGPMVAALVAVMAYIAYIIRRMG